MENYSKAWIVREYDKQQNPTPYKAYPNPEAKQVVFYLKSNDAKYGKLTLDKSNGMGKETFSDNALISATALAQANSSQHRLLYVSDILKEDIHISGLPSISVKAASSKAAVNFSVYLVSLPWNKNKGAKITENIITRGWADLQNHASLTKSSPLVPGKFYSIKFDLQPDDQIIKKGQQIGLMLFSSDSEYTISPKPGTELTIDLMETKLSIPIVGGKNAYKKAID